MGEKRKRSQKNNEPGDNKPGERGATKCQKVLAAIAAKQPFKITWSEMGFPTGPNAGRFSSWIGACTRQFVPIHLDDVRTLNPKLAELYLARVKEGFIIPDKSHDEYLMHKAADVHRQWRCDVARDWLYVDKATGEMRKSPPENKCPTISQEQWDLFKEMRTTEKFQVKYPRLLTIYLSFF